MTFIPLILAVIVVLSGVLMRDFSGTILRAVIEQGRTLAERTASVIKANPADMIGADDYLAIEGRKNEAAAFPFKSVAYYQRDPKSDAFTVGASTDRALVGHKVEGRVEPFAEAHRALRRGPGGVRVPGAGEPGGQVHRLRAGGLRPRRHLRALLPHPGEGLRHRRPVHLRRGVPDLPVRPQPGRSHPVPAHERERHRHQAVRHGARGDPQVPARRWSTGTGSPPATRSRACPARSAT